MASVFLSYAREDIERIRPLAAALERVGHQVWWDQHIGGGDEFSHAIEQALDSADAVVVVWTNASCHSAWVRDEAAAGRDSNRLVPVCLDGCTPPLGFRQFHAIDLRGWNGRSNSKALEPLKKAVVAKAGKAGSGAALVPAPTIVRRRLPEWIDKPRVIAAAAAMLLVVAAVLLLARTNAFASSTSLTPKVALGEFAVISPDLPQAMSRAMHDDVMASFGQENAVAVTASAGVSGRAAPFVLDGSIRKAADALRFTVSLKDTRSGTALWTRAFDRAAADPLATRQVAVAASQVIRCGLWGASAYPRRMPEQALGLYLNLCDEQWGGSPDDQRILDAARRVTVALPDFSFGWSALALAAVPLSHGTSAEAAALRKEALEAARKATQLDRHNPEGYMAHAGILPIERFVEREALLKKAISVRPTECGCERIAYGDFLTSVGRMDEAAEQYQRAQAIIPLSPAVTLRLAHALYLSGRDEEADRTASEMLKIWPDAVSLHQVRLKSALWTRRYDDALALLQKPGMHLTRAQREALQATFEALRSNDDTAKSAAVANLQEMAADPRRNDRLVVAALAALGAQSAAIDAARRLIRERGQMLVDVLFEPNLATASASPEYAALVSSVGLERYWRTTRSLPDICRQKSKAQFCAVA